MKKFVSLFGVSILLCMLLTACGIPKPPEANQISQDLSNEFKTLIVENPFDATNADVYDMNIAATVVKRQTNEKKDTVYCLVELTNEYYRITKYLELFYNYYDKGGWMLDGYSEYQAQDYELLSCPFEAEEIDAVLSNDYSNVKYKEIDEDFSNGGVTFYYEVEDIHKNGSYQGVVSVSLSFDGTQWDYEVNSDQVEFIWSIEGTWGYLETEKGPGGGTDIKEIKVIVDNFDQTEGRITGTWYMQAHFPFIQSHSETMYQLDDKEQVSISIDKYSVEFWDFPDKIRRHSSVRFFHDTVEAVYAGKFSEVQLERLENSSST